MEKFKTAAEKEQRINMEKHKKNSLSIRSFFFLSTLLSLWRTYNTYRADSELLVTLKPIFFPSSTLSRSSEYLDL